MTNQPVPLEGDCTEGRLLGQLGSSCLKVHLAWAWPCVSFFGEELHCLLCFLDQSTIWRCLSSLVEVNRLINISSILEFAFSNYLS